MAKAKKERPNLANATSGFLIDQIAPLRLRQKEDKDDEAFYRAALNARLKEGQTEVVGEKFIGTFTTSWRTALDQEAVKKEMGQEWWDDHCKSTEVVTLRVAPLEEDK